jgi:hypothetical protein
MDSLDLLRFFTENFSISTIYDVGWNAAYQWMALTSGVILVLAMMIRSGQELLAGSKSDWYSATKEFLLYAAAIALLFFLVDLFVDFFNAIYGALTASEAMNRLSNSLNTVSEYWERAEFEFSLTDFVNTVYGIGGFFIFLLSFMVLVFVTFALRIAHAILVTLAVFWAAVAIPMAPVNGLKSLSSLKVITLTAFIWPILDAFFMYLVASVFATGMEKAFDAQGGDTVTSSMLLFVLVVYSIINIFMAAASMAAPFVAQGLANGTGNVTGMIASFGAAGIAAGGVAGAWASQKFNKGGAAAGSGMAKGANAAGGALNQKFGLTTPPQRTSIMPKIGSVRESGMPSASSTPTPPPSGGVGSSAGLKSSSTSTSTSTAGAENKSSGAASSGKSSSAKVVQASPSVGASGVKARSVADSKATNEQVERQALESPEQSDPHPDGLPEQAKKAKARRGAIINNQKGKGKS